MRVLRRQEASLLSSIGLRFLFTFPACGRGHTTSTCPLQNRQQQQQPFCLPSRTYYRETSAMSGDAASGSSAAAPYEVRPIKLGVEVRGISLTDKLSPELIDRIKADTHKYRLMVFKDQQSMTPERQVEIGGWFGEIDWESYYKHPKSPSKLVRSRSQQVLYIFRVSNDELEGCTRVGRTGWHIDGTFRRAPYLVSIYHMPHVPRQGDTRFCGMAEIIDSLSPEQRSRWDRLWMVADRRGSVVHPLLYKHPITQLPTLCFHTGMIDAFIEDYGGETERTLDRQETKEMLKQIHEAVVTDNHKLIYPHKWEPGDFILSDNLAVAHEAAPESQIPREQVGLRVLHRVTIQGTVAPKK